ncbi:hypothetical protein EXU57_03105 [Segetibacter sp. 3557_3]|uniref:hypothetical protein n=1 Tax=Segetibacter sp. 3557_3 TaxID=2547429 RepID=UPI001058AF93|nr:hypothetical protein [Segetibacter sp. 3557_3]TDH29073.1 hypothetical protein EXU57_03105 [Segetibacter sp. 3557_3]
MKSLLLALVSVSFYFSISAQTVPHGMNFQAVARNSAGEILSNLELNVKVNLLSIRGVSSVSYYTETHAVTTNEIGLFSLVIGKGLVQSGKFDLIPWGTEEISAEVSFGEKGQTGFFAVDTSKLQTVPYAFYAASSGKAGETSSLSIKAGTNVSISGIGTSTDPLVISSSDSGSSTRITPGSNITVAGTGTVANPYVINATGSLASPLSSVMAAGNTTTRGIVVKQNDDNFLEIEPTNYNEALKQGKFSMAIKEFQGVNEGTSRSNVVGSFWGYNTTAGGGQQIPGEASYRFAGETHYVTTPYPGVTGPSFEFHIPEIYTAGGLGVRPFSMYIDKNSGLGSANYQMHNFNFKTVADAKVDWMTMKLDADHVKITMLPQYAGATSAIKMFDGNGNSSEIVSSNGLSLNVTSGNFNLNSNMYVKGEIFAKTLRGFSDRIDPNFMAHQLKGLTMHRSLLTVGDNENEERFAISSRAVVSYLPLLQYNNLELSGSIKSLGNVDLAMQVNTDNSNPNANFNFVNGATVVGKISKEGVYANSVQTDKPAGAVSAGKLKVGKVVSATVTAVSNKYLQIEIDGVPYKLALVE